MRSSEHDPAKDLTEDEFTIPYQERASALGICENGLSVVRIRYFYDFKTPFIINCKKEVLIYNGTGESVDTIIFPLGGFRKHLHIYDSTYTKLEFHKETTDYFGERERTEDFSIIIELPRDKPIPPQGFQTLEFEYIEDPEDYTKKNYSFTFSLEESPRTYISITSKSDKVRLIRHIKVHSTDGSKFYINDLTERNDISVYLTHSSLYFEAKKIIPNCNFVFTFRYELEKHQKRWISLGIFLGIVAVILNIFLLVFNSSLIYSVIIPFAALVNTFLLITKGWIFQNDMERVVYGRGGVTYDTYYVLLIILLTIEMIFGFIMTTIVPHIDFNSSFSFNIFTDNLTNYSANLVPI